MDKKRRERRRPAIKQPTWQNPLIEYWAARKQQLKPLKRWQEIPRRTRLEYRILAMFACFSISIGLWENFRQLWLVDNGLDVTEVSNLTSIGMFVSVVGIFLVGKFVKQRRTKRMMTTTLTIRSVNQLILFLLNGTGLTWLIYLTFIIDVTTGAIIITSVYPLLTGIMKSNNAYSRHKLVKYLFQDIGVLIGGIFIGQRIAGIIVDYNICLMISCGFSVAASIILGYLDFTPSQASLPTSRFSAVRYVLRNRIQRMYMFYVLVSCASYHAAIGLRMLMLTGYFDLSASMATNYLLIVGLISDVLGIIALRYFTPKNDYATIWIKFGIRAGIYTLAFITGSVFVCFLALTWALLSMTAYEDVTDGYYINSVDNRHQLKYNTLKYVVNYIGDAIGIFLCGQMLELGAHYVFGMAALLSTISLISACYLIKLRQDEKKNSKRTKKAPVATTRGASAY